MKRKIDKINNKRLVQGGGVNTLSDNEILVEQKDGKISLKERVNGEIKELSGNGNTNDSEEYKYYLIDWSNISTSPEYPKDVIAEVIKYLDCGYYTAYIMPSKAVFTGPASFIDYENWGLYMYKAMRWKFSNTSFDEEVGNMSPKQFLEFMGGETPILSLLAERMTECTEEEFYALTK